MLWLLASWRPGEGHALVPLGRARGFTRDGPRQWNRKWQGKRQEDDIGRFSRNIGSKFLPGGLQQHIFLKHLLNLYILN